MNLIIIDGGGEKKRKTQLGIRSFCSMSNMITRIATTTDYTNIIVPIFVYNNRYSTKHIGNALDLHIIIFFISPL